MFQKPDDMPLSVVILSVLGLLVFLFLALSISLGTRALALNAYIQLIQFSALILTFVAAIQWGFGLTAAARQMSTPTWWFPTTLLPMILAWLALAIPGPIWKILLLAAGFAIAFLLDTISHSRGYAPPWYKGLRKFLTLGVLVSLIVALFATHASLT
ncbi:MAG: DUF3429 domain-containing protein [Pseudomonadota bacterium]|nr:DUF3429 domain-containing protein [Pseudomonadota bacterium]